MLEKYSFNGSGTVILSDPIIETVEVDSKDQPILTAIDTGTVYSQPLPEMGGNIQPYAIGDFDNTVLPIDEVSGIFLSAEKNQAAGKLIFYAAAVWVILSILNQ